MPKTIKDGNTYMKTQILFLLILIIFSGCQSSKYRQSVVVRSDQELPSVLNTDVAAASKFQKSKNQKKFVIVVDAGHGGEDMGTRSLIPPKYQEKSLNLSTAFFLREYLQKMGYLVKMTRIDDTFVPLAKRSLIANNEECNLFVSVHYNAATSELADGIEVYYYKSDENKARSLNSKKCADLVLNQLILKTGAKSRGVKHGNLSVIRETTMPAILVEGGFMTHKGEMEKIKDPGYIKQLAYGIALGIDAYAKADPTSRQK